MSKLCLFIANFAMFNEDSKMPITYINLSKCIFIVMSVIQQMKGKCFTVKRTWKIKANKYYIKYQREKKNKFLP